MSWTWSILVLVVAQTPPDGGAPDAAAPAPLPRYTVDGVVLLKGRAPRIEATEVALDVEACGRKKTKPGLTVSKRGGIKNAVVFLESGQEGPSQAGVNAAIEQSHCEFVPHVLVVPVGSTVSFTNGDDIAHDVHVFSPTDPFNQSHARGAPLAHLFDQPGPTKIKCDFHVWMSAWVYVVGTRSFSLTDADGRFHVPEVPAGKQKLRLWHETLGAWDQDVEVPATSLVRFELPATGAASAPR